MNVLGAYRNPGDKAPLRSVTVHNTGEALLKGTAAMLSSSSPGMTLIDTSPVDIPGDGSHDFVVKFAPTTVATVTGQLVLTNNDSAKPMATPTAIAWIATSFSARGRSTSASRGSGSRSPPPASSRSTT